MHELSVAQRLVELVCDELGDSTSITVRSVLLRLGPLSGVDAQALRFAYDAATAGTLLDRSTLHIESVAPAGYCPTCNTEVELPDFRRLRCPACGTPTPDLVRGLELEVVSVEVVDAPETVTAV